MAKTGGAVQKLRDKSNHKATALRMGTNKPIIARTTTPYNDKAIAFAEHKRAIHGLVVTHGDREVVVDHGGRNPKAAETFRGDGLPEEVIPGSKNWTSVKPPKTAAERAAGSNCSGHTAPAPSFSPSRTSARRSYYLGGNHELSQNRRLALRSPGPLRLLVLSVAARRLSRVTHGGNNEALTLQPIQP